MNRARRTDLAGDACEAFIRWYSSAGHWIHDGRADAVRVWTQRGITTLAPAPLNAGPLLADWVEADPMPPLLAHLRADELALRERMPQVQPAEGSAVWLPLEAS